jgi:hypothetical protein
VPNSAKKILYVPLEYAKWQSAKHWAYPAGLGLEEGFGGHGAECFILPGLIRQPFFAPETFLDHARRLCAGRRFDMVVLTLPHIKYNADFLAWLSEVAPMRVGYFVESMEPYCGTAGKPASGRKRRLTQRALPYLTHALVWDEGDAAYLTGRGIPTMWCPTIIPERFVKTRQPASDASAALFFGAVYGERARYLDHPALTGLLKRPERSLEHETEYPQIFDALNAEVMLHLAAEDNRNPKLIARRIKRRLWWFARRPFGGRKDPSPGTTESQLESCAGHGIDGLLAGYLERLRECRLKNFELWLETLAQGLAVVNLPQAGFGYAGRVVESMAVGRPVLAHRVPNRPQTNEFFESGREILLYESPEELADQIRLLQKDAGLRDRLVKEARRKLLQLHTSEKRVGQLFRWLETGEQPVYVKRA